jgi:hypothetical protein
MDPSQNTIAAVMKSGKVSIHQLKVRFAGYLSVLSESARIYRSARDLDGRSGRRFGGACADPAAREQRRRRPQ